MKHTDKWRYRLWAKRNAAIQKNIKMAVAYNKSSEELLLEAATVLKRWSKEHHTSGYQHEPMSILSTKIFRHLNTLNKALDADLEG